MDDLGEKLQQFLSAPGAMDQVAAVAKSLGLDAAGPSQPPASRDPSRAGPLLEALRPFLQDGGKVDRAKRALRLVEMARLAAKTIDL